MSHITHEVFKLPRLENIKIIGIDPGTNYLGCAILSIHPITHEVVDITAQTFFAKHLAEYDKQLALVHGELVARLFAYREFLTKHFKKVKPTLIGSESPFFYRMHPGAFGPLVETLAIIREATWNYDNTLPLIKVPPSNVKKAINAKGNATKDDMTKALLKYEPFNVLSKDYIKSLDEHSVDAIAVSAYIYQNHIQENKK